MSHRSRKTKRSTRYGTPLSPQWDETWADRVEQLETTLNRRICGARTIDGAPCTLFSDHPSGRCRFHGGFDATGAPDGNRNARLHGLFLRRLQDCGTHCPRFARCPLAAQDVADLPDSGRPVCPYEDAEYGEAVVDLNARVERTPEAYDYARQYGHHIALLQVMVGRAARAIAATPDDRPALDTFLRLAGEYRRALHPPHRARYVDPLAHDCGPVEIGLADEMKPILKKAEGVLEEVLAYKPRKRKSVPQEDYSQGMPFAGEACGESF